MAQQAETGLIDYEAWERVATRAENAMEAARASTQALRDAALRAGGTGARLQGRPAGQCQHHRHRQEPARGARPPARGRRGGAAIAKQRAQLNDRLAELQAPVKRAELAFSRADGLIRGSTASSASARPSNCFALGPSPANPAHWSQGLEALLGAARQMQSEVLTGWTNPTQRERMQQSLPLAVILLLVGRCAARRGRIWSRRLSQDPAGHDSAGRWMVGFLVSMGSSWCRWPGSMR